MESHREKVCCGIVLYNPEREALVKNIEALVNQVDSIVMIDNASKNKDEIIEIIGSYENVTAIWNEKNLGVAAALNQIMHYASEHGYEWFVTMDQDSQCDTGLVEKYFEHIDGRKIAECCPYLLNNGKVTLEEYLAESNKSEEIVDDPTSCITSGSIVNTAAALDVGGFNESLFIDCVDTEFNIRLHKNGYIILKVNSTYMLQTMGKAHKVGYLDALYRLTGADAFRRTRYTPVYNNMRLYYIARNSKFVRRTYGEAAGKRTSKSWMTIQFLYYTFTYPLSVSRIGMWKSIRKGLREDGLVKDI